MRYSESFFEILDMLVYNWAFKLMSPARVCFIPMIVNISTDHSNLGNRHITRISEIVL